MIDKFARNTWYHLMDENKELREITDKLGITNNIDTAQKIYENAQHNLDLTIPYKEVGYVGSFEDFKKLAFEFVGILNWVAYYSEKKLREFIPIFNKDTWKEVLEDNRLLSELAAEAKITSAEDAENVYLNYNEDMSEEMKQFVFELSQVMFDNHPSYVVNVKKL